MAEAMHDRAKFWWPVPDWSEAKLEDQGFSARPVAGLGQTLLSGDLRAATQALAPGAEEIGLWQVANGGSLGVRIARDRALLVTPSPLGVAPGWREGFVATPCDDGHAVIEIAGDEIGQIVAEATSAGLHAGSRSAAVLFAGVPVLLYRSAERTARLHVETPLAAHLWTWLRDRA